MDEKEMCKVFARNLKNLIHKHDINQEELSQKLGVAKSSVSCWINAKYLRNALIQAEFQQYQGFAELAIKKTLYKPQYIKRHLKYPIPKPFSN